MRIERKNNESGMALVITLMITAMLVVVIAEIAYGVHLHQSMSAIFTDSQDAGLLAEGGVDLAGAAIKDMTEDTYTKIDEDATQAIPVGENLLSLRARDEQGRVSVKAIIFEGNGEINEKRFAFYERLLKVLDLDPVLADAAADWIDPDSSPLDSVGELALVKGYSPEVMAKLRPFITAFSDGLININNAPKEVLMALSEDITGDMADAVIDYRKETPFEGILKIGNVEGFSPGVVDSIRDLITVKSDIFRIFSKGSSGEAMREVEAVVRLGEKNKRLFWRER